MKTIKVIYVILCLGFLTLNAQSKKGNIWYFGSYAGLDFNSGSPVALTNGELKTWEGCSSIADDEGELLFYMDGATIYTRNHQIMPNGTDLKGRIKIYSTTQSYTNYESSQAALILTNPYNDNRHYIFSIGPNTHSGLYYSEVDMSLGTDGMVTSVKNIQLHSTANEKLTAVKHSNEQDFWIITYEYSTNSYYAYLVDQNGVHANPVISTLPSDPNKLWVKSIGCLKASRDGSYLAAAHFYDNYVELLNFDNITGKITFDRSIDENIYHPYGIEFSPSGQFLYVSNQAGTGMASLWQYDLQETNVAQVKAKIYQDYDNATQCTGHPGSLQLGPDAKVYFTVLGNTYLHAINSPDEKGSNCNFLADAVYLNGKSTTLGLPNIMSSYIDMPGDFLCLGDEALLSFEEEGVTDVQWNFGDTNSGVLNEASGLNVKHVFSYAGTFNVNMSVTKNGVTETIEKEITIKPSPVIDIVDQLYLCNDPYVILDAYNEGATYEWSNETYASSIETSIAGNYSVTVTNEFGCISNKNIEVFEGCDNNVLYLPSAFSPNGDGANDILYVRGQQIESLDFSVYNRSGKLVFKTQDQLIGWDGNYKGKALSNEVFVANLLVTFLNGEQKHLQGDVTLVR